MLSDDERRRRERDRKRAYRARKRAEAAENAPVTPLRAIQNPNPSRGHSAALVAMLDAAEVLRKPEHAAVVELAVSLASRLDESDDPSASLLAVYRGALRDMRAIVAAESAAKSERSPKNHTLTRLREQAAACRAKAVIR